MVKERKKFEGPTRAFVLGLKLAGLSTARVAALTGVSTSSVKAHFRCAMEEGFEIDGINLIKDASVLDAIISDNITSLAAPRRSIANPVLLERYMADIRIQTAKSPSVVKDRDTKVVQPLKHEDSPEVESPSAGKGKTRPRDDGPVYSDEETV
ncbi:hypothetical protein N7470_006229 [Penicillium chermesinum]|nr:hypothetical protein N7470_006229 [Penicillium chermesinum]